MRATLPKYHILVTVLKADRDDPYYLCLSCGDPYNKYGWTTSRDLAEPLPIFQAGELYDQLLHDNKNLMLNRIIPLNTSATLKIISANRRREVLREVKITEF